MLSRFLLIGIFSILLMSCEKDNNSEPIPTILEDASQFLPLSPGNYWVYQWYTINLQTGDETLVNKLDSVYVASDTIIGIDTFYVVRGTWFDIPFERVIKHEGTKIIDPNGRVFFWSGFELDTLAIDNNTANQFIDSVYTVVYSIPHTYTVPAGTFTSIHQYDKIFYLNAQLGHNYLTRHETDFYTKGIGITKYTSYFAGSPNDTEMRLLRFDVSN